MDGSIVDRFGEFIFLFIVNIVQPMFYTNEQLDELGILCSELQFHGYFRASVQKKYRFLRLQKS